MKKKISTLLFALLLLISPLCIAAPTAYAEGTPTGYVVMSVEKLTLGQGFIMEPQRVPYYAGENLAQVLDRALGSDNYQHTRTLEKGFYLAAVKDGGRESIEATIPAYIKEMHAAAKAASPNTPDFAYTDKLDPEYLGEFDYYSQSGWMFSVNNGFPPVGAADISAADGLVVRWQFTLIGYGGDLGGTSTTAAGSVSHMNRTELYTVMAAVRASNKLMADTNVRAAYDRVLEASKDITMTREAVQDDLNVMKLALGSNQITEVRLPRSESGVRTYPFGTAPEKASQGLPTYLPATVDGESKILTDVTWTSDTTDFTTPGTYSFRPVLPSSYDNYVLTAELPLIQITLLPPSGDMNGDGALDALDISRLAGLLGTDSAACDLDGSGMVAWNDLRLLAAALDESALTLPGGEDAPAAAAAEVTGGTATVTVPEGTVYDTVLMSAPAGTTLTSPDFLTVASETDDDDFVTLCAVSMDGAAAGNITLTCPEGTTGDITLVLLCSGKYVTLPDADTMRPLAVNDPNTLTLYGDLNGDGVVNSTDAGLLIQYCNGMRELTEEQLAAAELSGDGEVTLRDAALLIQYCNGLIDSLPVASNKNQ